MQASGQCNFEGRLPVSYQLIKEAQSLIQHIRQNPQFRVRVDDVQKFRCKQSTKQIEQLLTQLKDLKDEQSQRSDISNRLDISEKKFQDLSRAHDDLKAKHKELIQRYDHSFQYYIQNTGKIEYEYQKKILDLKRQQDKTQYHGTLQNALSQNRNLRERLNNLQAFEAQNNLLLQNLRDKENEIQRLLKKLDDEEKKSLRLSEDLKHREEKLDKANSQIEYFESIQTFQQQRLRKSRYVHAFKSRSIAQNYYQSSITSYFSCNPNIIKRLLDRVCNNLKDELKIEIRQLCYSRQIRSIINQYQAAISVLDQMVVNQQQLRQELSDSKHMCQHQEYLYQRNLKIQRELNGILRQRLGESQNRYFGQAISRDVGHETDMRNSPMRSF